MFEIIPSSVSVDELANVVASIDVRLTSSSGELTFSITIDLQAVQGTAIGEFHTVMVDLCCMCTSHWNILSRAANLNQ